ncbi:RNase A-like domain-containing protein [Coleofasciculus sp. H7-2]|uniref:RNase A-like domain-containing protein n=1 Tax=Coleofasciculus sp. H7-2 TaxID=3351545 RepID=UPI00366F18DD
MRSLSLKINPYFAAFAELLSKATQFLNKKQAVTNFSRLVPGGGLTAHELAGGHTLARHIGQTQAQLANRLASEPRRRLVSSFDNRSIAEEAIANALTANLTVINTWLSLSGGGSRLSINHNASIVVGTSLVRGASTTVPVANVTAVLVRDASSLLGYYILTAYPES